MKKNLPGVWGVPHYIKKNLLKMKLTLLVVCLCAFSVMASSQKVTLNVADVALNIALNQLKNQTGVRILYDVGQTRNIQCKDFQFHEVELKEVLDRLLEDTSLDYQIIDGVYVIRELLPLDKGVKVSGQVVDGKGIPLPGVSVVLKGTTTGVATDVNGNFELIVSGVENPVLVFSFVGMKTSEMVVAGGKPVRVVLEEDARVMDEVMCTGVQTISRERATGAFKRIGAETLNQTLTSDFTSRLAGKVAGLQVDQNNKITIRGRGTIISNTEPLIVVDGFPIEGGIETVNPDDIENVTVLKDAAAASIWGVRAGNGVIVITTRKGEKNGKSAFDISYTLTVDQKPDIGDLRLLQGEESIEHQLELLKKKYWEPYSIINYNAPVNKVQEAYYNTLLKYGMEQSFDQIIANSDFQAEMERLKRADLPGQFSDKLLRNALKSRLNAVFRGGTERSDFYLSALYNFNKDAAVGNRDNEVQINMKHNYQALRNLTFSSVVSLHYGTKEENGIEETELIYEMPFHDLTDAKGKRIQYYMVDPWEGKRREEMGYLPYTTNMLDVVDQNDHVTKSFTARLQAALTLKIIEGLNVETRFQYERGHSKEENFMNASHPEMRRLINTYTLVNDDGSLDLQFPLGGALHFTKNDFEAWTWRNQLTFNKGFCEDKHQVTALLGQEMRKYKFMGNSQSQYGYDNTSLTYVPMSEDLWRKYGYSTWGDFYGDEFPAFSSYRESDNRDISLYMNGAYTYGHKYTLSVSGRIDQSNIFGNDSKYRYNMIWSAGMSWKVSEEEFARKEWLDLLLLRLTYGIGGNVNKQFYPVLMGESRVDDLSGATYIALVNPANKNLKWETSRTLNIGFDFAAFSNRLNMTFDYYHKQGIDLLGRVALDPTNGFNSAQMNFASVVNQGFELSVSGKLLATEKFSWTLGGNITYNKNKVTKVDTEGTSEDDFLYPAHPGRGIAVKGKPLGRLYAYRYAGLNSSGEPMLWEDGKKIHFSEYSQKTEQLKYMGTTEAPCYGGLSTRLEYKGFGLSANATYKFGHKFRMPVSSVSTSWKNVTKEVANRWKKSGDESVTNIPYMKDGMYSWEQMTMEDYYIHADINVKNAAFLKLNELSVDYRFSGNMLAKLPLSSLSMSFQIRNVCQWVANDEKIDPETIHFDPEAYMDIYSYGLSDPRSFIIGVKATF